MSKVITYIDGFNLYFGLKRKKWNKYYWLDIQKLSENLLIGNDTLERVKYFSAKISKPEDKRKRQQTYLEALGTLNLVDIFYGTYQMSQIKCRSCHSTFNQPSEKKTDVNIAVEMLSDAFNDNFDKAFLISADSDLVPPIEKIKMLFPMKKVIVAFPPGNHSNQLKQTTTSLQIFEKNIKNSQFSDFIVSNYGYKLERPIEWK